MVFINNGSEIMVRTFFITNCY